MTDRKARVLRVENGLRIFDLGSAGIPSFGIFPRRKVKQPKRRG